MWDWQSSRSVRRRRLQRVLLEHVKIVQEHGNWFVPHKINKYMRAPDTQFQTPIITDKYCLRYSVSNFSSFSYIRYQLLNMHSSKIKTSGCSMWGVKFQRMCWKHCAVTCWNYNVCMIPYRYVLMHQWQNYIRYIDNTIAATSTGNHIDWRGKGRWDVCYHGGVNTRRWKPCIVCIENIVHTFRECSSSPVYPSSVPLEVLSAVFVVANTVACVGCRYHPFEEEIVSRR